MENNMKIVKDKKMGFDIVLDIFNLPTHTNYIQLEREENKVLWMENNIKIENNKKMKYDVALDTFTISINYIFS